jgi:hypothetical protein
MVGGSQRPRWSMDRRVLHPLSPNSCLVLETESLLARAHFHYRLGGTHVYSQFPVRRH